MILLVDTAAPDGVGNSDVLGRAAKLEMPAGVSNREDGFFVDCAEAGLELLPVAVLVVVERGGSFTRIVCVRPPFIHGTRTVSDVGSLELSRDGRACTGWTEDLRNLAVTVLVAVGLDDGETSAKPNRYGEPFAVLPNEMFALPGVATLGVVSTLVEAVDGAALRTVEAVSSGPPKRPSPLEGVNEAGARDVLSKKKRPPDAPGDCPVAVLGGMEG